MSLIQCGPSSQFVFELVSPDPTPAPPPPPLSLSHSWRSRLANNELFLDTQQTLTKRKIGLLIQNDPRRKSKKWPKDVYVSSHFRLCKTTFLVRSANTQFRWRTHPLESSILRLTRAVQTTSMASTQHVSGLAVGWGNYARIFVDLRLCGDRSACRVLTPLSALAPTVLTSSKLRFWHAHKGEIKEEKTSRQGSWTVNCRLTTEKVCFLSPEGRSSEIVKCAAAGRTDCEKIARVQSTLYRPEVSHIAQTKKNTHRCGQTLAYLAIKASISARNAANSWRDLLD